MSDEKPTTLALSPASMDLAEKVFKLGRYKIPRYFEELTREFLFLPHDQNETLNSNLIMETFFKKYEKDPAFSHIFSYKDQISNV